MRALTDRERRVNTTIGAAWTLEAVVGEGATAIVYAARHTQGRRAAIKILRRELAADAEIRRRFDREVELGRSVRHPNVIDIWGLAQTDDGVPAMLMELLEGETWAQRSRREAPTLVTVVRVALRVLDGLSACHAKGVIHRDVKPSNVFLLTNGEVKLVDFGVARDRDRSHTSRTIALGTPTYMAPEQARAEKWRQDERTDVFGVGATLYAVIRGAVPHGGDDDVALDRAARESPSPLVIAAPHIPRSLASAVDRAMCRDPSGRWQSARSFRAALEVVEADLLATDRPSRAAICTTRTMATPIVIDEVRESRETLPDVPPASVPALG